MACCSSCRPGLTLDANGSSDDSRRAPVRPPLRLAPSSLHIAPVKCCSPVPFHECPPAHHAHHAHQHRSRPAHKDKPPIDRHHCFGSPSNTTSTFLKPTFFSNLLSFCSSTGFAVSKKKPKKNQDTPLPFRAHTAHCSTQNLNLLYTVARWLVGQHVVRKLSPNPTCQLRIAVLLWDRERGGGGGLTRSPKQNSGEF